MKLSSSSIIFLLGIVGINTTPVSYNSPIGFGQNTTGGAGGVEYHVNTLKELKDALQNNGKPNDPKIIYIDSPINGYYYDDGSLMTEENLAPGFTFEKYMNCFTEDGKEWLGTPECEEIEKLRKNGMKPLQNQIKVKVTSNTSIIGNGDASRLEELVIQIGSVDNVILQNLSIQAPNDLFPQWTMNDGWSCKYDAIVIQSSTNVWVDNCLIDDGKRIVENEPKYFGQNVERHDGLIDIVKGSDLVTLSNNRFANHRKTILIGNSDSYTADRDHLRVTMYNNVFINCWQRMPRVRFGKVHIFNNYYYADNFRDYPVQYHDDGTVSLTHIFLGLGLESNILSEYNSFNYYKLNKFTNSTAVILSNYGGYQFHDNGSKYNGHKYNLDALAKKEFELNVESTKAKNLANGGTNPEWVNATFTTKTFNPKESYNYKVVKSINRVNELEYSVPTWMFDEESNSSSEEE
ncbi:pectin lyase-like protein [Neocallimastix lanati (nom. inval.)]|uniref:Pectin lyase-like protein n=1 Tax=Neocallimastix californiae TaxID=1754190 RepID=A0A1Y2FEX8_9FUNG|nr:pectin lyase-like protein [Neocallimastix sp. JGI-2020a]ORY82167.1 pectin lyase-like protein [Neocallimastix californiae]|eukprot:ORY82167.1 pectin lyase-like protein [Neocallimastix californiae]